LLLALCFAILYCCLGTDVKVLTPTDATSNAQAAWESYITKFWNTNVLYLEDTYPSKGVKTQYWVFAEGYQTLVDYLAIIKNTSYEHLVDQFYTSQDKIGWYRNYYDDEAWMANALITAYEVTGLAKYLTMAETLFKDIQNQWDTTCCGSIKGGVWWDKPHTQKATASNGGGIIVGARIYSHNKDMSILDWCVKVYWFWYHNMVNQATGQVADHIASNGDKLWWKFTYNEGLMIGAGTYLFESTNNATYLQNSEKIANFMIKNEVKSNQYGAVLYDGPASSCSGDCTEFKGPGFKYLAALYAHDKNSDYFAVLSASAQSLWNVARDPRLNLFGVDWTQPYNNPTVTYQSQQNAATMALINFAGIQ